MDFPPIIVTDEEINHFFESLEKVLDKGLVLSVLSFLKNKYFRDIN